MPLDAYAFTVSEEGEIGRARNILIGDCMRRSGFEFDSNAAIAAKAEQSTQNDVKDNGVYGNKRRYGVTDMATAMRYGYHLVSVATGTAPTPPAKGEGNPHGLGELTPAKSAALTQCAGEAASKIGNGGRVGEADLVTEISRDSYDRSLSDPGVTAAFAKWSDCMKGKGYNYASPREAGDGFDIDAMPISAAEIAAAQGDVRCQQQTNLFAIWFGYEVRYQKAQIEQHAQELQAIKGDHDARMKRVAEVIARGS